MNKKYLYGKKFFLKNFIEGKSVRFSDLSHYSRLENKLMKDDEKTKKFSCDRYATCLTINGCVINSNNMTKNPVFSMPVRHCYCLCLSNRKNSKELFNKFQADVCIEIDVDKMLEALNYFFSHKLKGMEIQAKNIIYYDPLDSLPKSNEEELIFYTANSFLHEDEFRITLLYPRDKKGFKAEDGVIIPFFKENESTHMYISHTDPTFITQFILNIADQDVRRYDYCSTL